MRRNIPIKKLIRLKQLCEMKKNLILLISLLASFQLVNAQTNPALLTDFKIEGSSNECKISWRVANNEVVNKFELQRSLNGTDYSTVAVIHTSYKKGTEAYTYNEQRAESSKLMYRLKMTSNGQEIYYSAILYYTLKPVFTEKISILGNPAKEKLMLRFNEFRGQPTDIRIYDLQGKVISGLVISHIEKNEIVNIPLASQMSSGIYIVEINNGSERLTGKFIK